MLSMGLDASQQGLTRFGTPSKDRMHELLSLAQAYRGWTLKELAKFLGRDSHNIVPDSGVPKLDLVIRLAEALDWPISSVIEDICTGARLLKEDDRGPTSFRDLNRAAYDAHVSGQYWEEVQLSLKAQRVATSPAERAEASLREHLGWGGLGRYQLALEATERGLGEPEVGLQLRFRLRTNLANAYFCLGRFAEAEGLATGIIDWFTRHPTEDVNWISMRAMALYVRGQSRRSQALLETELLQELSELARQDLQRAEFEWEQFSDRVGIEGFRGVAHTCRGALLTIDVIQGQRTPSEVIARVDDELDRVVDVGTFPPGDWLESYGWWCLFGCQVALRGIEDPLELDRRMAIYTNKAYEIADRLGNWMLRERALALDYLRRSRETGLTIAASSLTLDSEDLKSIAGTMGRFPAFRDLGWKMLRQARNI